MPLIAFDEHGVGHAPASLARGRCARCQGELVSRGEYFEHVSATNRACRRADIMSRVGPLPAESPRSYDWGGVWRSALQSAGAPDVQVVRATRAIRVQGLPILLVCADIPKGAIVHVDCAQSAVVTVLHSGLSSFEGVADGVSVHADGVVCGPVDSAAVRRALALVLPHYRGPRDPMPVWSALCSCSLPRASLAVDEAARRAALARVPAVDAPLLISAHAGAGKSTLLMQWAAAHADQSALYLVFNRSLQMEMQARVDHEPSLRHVSVRTLDSLCAELANGEGELMDDDALVASVTSLDRDSREVRSLVDTWRLLVNTSSAAVLPSCAHHARLFRALWQHSGLRNTFLGRRWVAFKTLLHDAEGADVLRAGGARVVLVDEWQDLPAPILRRILSRSSLPFVAVGDWRQRIFAFQSQPASACRGCAALVDAGGLSDWFPPASTISLSGSRRVPDMVARLVHDVTEHSFASLRARPGRVLLVGGSSMRARSFGMDAGGRCLWLFRHWADAAARLRSLHALGFDHVTVRSPQSMADSLARQLEDGKVDAELVDFCSGLLDRQAARGVSPLQVDVVHQVKGCEFDNVRIAHALWKLCLSGRDCEVVYVALTRARDTLIIEQTDV